MYENCCCISKSYIDLENLPLPMGERLAAPHLKKRKCFFHKKKQTLQQEYYTGEVWMLRKQKTVSFNHEELDYSKGT